MLEKLESVGRLDIIWNPYLPQSLKQATIQKEEEAVVCQLKSVPQLLQILERSLKLEQNKAKLSNFLAENIGFVPAEWKQLSIALENNSVYAAHITNVHDTVKTRIKGQVD